MTALAVNKMAYSVIHNGVCYRLSKNLLDNSVKSQYQHLKHSVYCVCVYIDVHIYIYLSIQGVSERDKGTL